MSNLKSSQSVSTPAHLTASLDAWKGDIREKALNYIYEFMPQKCIALTEYLNSDARLKTNPATVGVLKPGFAMKAPSSSKNGNGRPTKRRRVEGSADESEQEHQDAEQLPIHPLLTTMLDKLRDDALEFMDCIYAIRIFIQEEVLGELTRAEESSLSMLDQAAKYYLSRGKVLAKCLKHPTVDDYVYCVNSLDRKQFIDTRVSFCDLRNSYALLNDLVQKNIDKLLKPRSSHAAHMF